MTRISMLPVSEWDPELRAIVAADEATTVEQGMYRILAHTPGVAKAFAGFGAGLFANRRLPRRLVELVRLGNVGIRRYERCKQAIARPAKRRDRVAGLSSNVFVDRGAGLHVACNASDCVHDDAVGDVSARVNGSQVAAVG